MDDCGNNSAEGIYGGRFLKMTLEVGRLAVSVVKGTQYY